MAFDIDLIKKVYSEMSSRIEHAKKIIGKPLTLTEKVLYSHLWNNEISSAYSVTIRSGSGKKLSRSLLAGGWRQTDTSPPVQSVLE